jgi:hypothetical protein
MDSRVLLTLIFVCLSLPPVGAESEADSKAESGQRALAVLREWSEENQSFTSVRGDFHRIWYDDVFCLQKHADGEFGYLTPRHGFWRFGPPREKPKTESLKKTIQGTPYQYKEAESEQWCWQKTRLLMINGDEKKYEEFIYPNLPQQREVWGFFQFPVDGLYPFLPGVPNQARFDDLLKHCHLKVFKESETHIWIAGKPMPIMHAQNFSEFQLYLEKSPWRLKAAQYIHPGGNQRTVYLFSNIEMNPLEWDEPDLAGYLNLSARQLVVLRPEPEVTAPEVTEDGAVWNTLIALIRVFL